MPSPEFISPINPKGKVVNIAPDIPVPVFETAPQKNALFQAPSSGGRRSAGCLIPYIKSQPGPLYESPYKGSSEAASSTVYPSSNQSSDAPPAFKRIRSESMESASPFNNQLKEIAHCILLDIFDFFNFYAPCSPQEASAHVYIITQIQKHFNVFLKSERH
ncbi:hypothetical protein PTTG_01114 [Puccinia triticina 1-1 BBBD Race 1]|uniref:Uncharacterized protein n=1 Tax=Puccinia triticina (isolate 1-1 / race 1 (BBBD)) TaxID=630390 RepID=A0A180G4C0_PUCT1|nr:hypothetical protein PTTG_01114 [Puccinia triticina 1-1 BBBD Race 1]